LVFKEEYQCYKYGNLLNLNHTIPVKNRLLEGDEFLFSDKWRLCDYDLCEPKSSKCPNGVTSYEEWLECRMDGYYFKSIFETLFWAEFFIAIAIAIVIVAAGILNGFSHTPKQIGIGQQQPAIQDLPYQNHYYFPR
jgi:hypothetical protein